MSTTLRLPTSPLKPSVLQQQNLNVGNIVNVGTSISALLSASKPVQVLTASADSTGDEQESENRASVKPSGRKRGGGRKKGDKNKTKKTAVSTSRKGVVDRSSLVVATTLNGVPFVKHHHSVKKPQTPSVSRRNARERNRVKQVNNSFTVLRDHIPNIKNKTSKVDTLRAAVEYIQSLRQLVGEDITDRFQGPVLITDQEDDKSIASLDDSALTSSSLENTRPMSALSGDLNHPMSVYQLPQPAACDDRERGSSASPRVSSSNYEEMSGGWGWRQIPVTTQANGL